MNGEILSIETAKKLAKLQEENKELQEKNERLKEELQQEKKDFKEANDYCFELKDYKSRNEKAREYIKEHWVIDEPVKFKNDLLNILNGDKDE